MTARQSNAPQSPCECGCTCPRCEHGHSPYRTDDAGPSHTDECLHRMMQRWEQQVDSVMDDSEPDPESRRTLQDSTGTLASGSGQHPAWLGAVVSRPLVLREMKTTGQAAHYGRKGCRRVLEFWAFDAVAEVFSAIPKEIIRKWAKQRPRQKITGCTLFAVCKGD